jgi:hypothetical protein
LAEATFVSAEVKLMLVSSGSFGESANGRLVYAVHFRDVRSGLRL